MPTHRRLDVVGDDFFPAYVVWELTLRCDPACTHCGSRAGVARDGELTTAEALGVVDQLAAMRAREVVLIGGEAYLHDGFLEVVAALRGAGIVPVMTTGGRGVTAALAGEMAAAGLASASVSIDGMAAAHDRMRGWRGSFAAASAAIDHLAAAGIVTGANTNLNRSNRGELEALYDHLVGRVRGWQIQLTAPLGRAADRADLILQPWDLLELVPRIAALKQRGLAAGLVIQPGNNLGYFGPEEALLRSHDAGGRDHWAGCQAGRYVLGIESHGDVKGCPSLQSAHYVGGNLRRRRLADIWGSSPELAFTRARTVADLWGFCRDCAYAEVCLGGCSFTAHAILGRPGNNPYCHHRARTLARQGLRERLVAAAPASGQPFDCGTFELVVEPLDAADPAAAVEADDLVRITRRPARA